MRLAILGLQSQATWYNGNVRSLAFLESERDKGSDDARRTSGGDHSIHVYTAVFYVPGSDFSPQPHSQETGTRANRSCLCLELPVLWDGTEPFPPKSLSCPCSRGYNCLLCLGSHNDLAPPPTIMWSESPPRFQYKMKDQLHGSGSLRALPPLGHFRGLLLCRRI
jgi:hypothetical protein